MQVSVVTSVVAGQTTVATEDVEKFMTVISDQLGDDYTFTLDADYGASLDTDDADVYLVYFGSQANLTATQKSKMIIFYSDDDVQSGLIGRFVDMLKQLKQK